MEGKFRSINFKVWWIITTTMIIFFGTVLILNVTVIKKIKNEFIFDHLKEASQIMRSQEQKFSRMNRPMGPPPNNYIGPAEIENFKITKNADNDFDILMDPFRMEFDRNKKKGEKSLEEIVTHIIKNKNNKGILKEKKRVLFYYIDWQKDDSSKFSESATVFLTSLPQDNDLGTGLFLGMLFIFIISFLISIIIAKKISTPVKQLKLFAEEIAKRNWSFSRITDSL